MSQVRASNYQDFVIGTPKATFYVMRPVSWLLVKFGLIKTRPNYYGTMVRRVGTSKIEVTFDLPPNIKQQMSSAIEAGKQIRLFVL